jgi:hypothetical protein
MAESMVEAKPFRLGEEWPDWWAARHARNEVTTHNVDGRWRDGPDYALIHTPNGQIKKLFGELISPSDFAALNDPEA